MTTLPFWTEMTATPVSLFDFKDAAERLKRATEEASGEKNCSVTVRLLQAPIEGPDVTTKDGLIALGEYERASEIHTTSDLGELSEASWQDAGYATVSVNAADGNILSVAIFNRRHPRAISYHAAANMAAIEEQIEPPSRGGMDWLSP